MWCWSDGGYEMQCPYCDFEDTKVIDSRLSETKDAVRRRRECLSRSCGKRFTTYERREPLRLMVIKRDGGKEPFDREKLRSGMAKACAKQQITDEQQMAFSRNFGPLENARGGNSVVVRHRAARYKLAPRAGGSLFARGCNVSA